MKQVLITGASGFIGSALALRLLRDGVAVRAMCRSTQKGAMLAQAGAEVVIGDVQHAETLRRPAQGCDVIFHVAAVGAGSATTQYSVNVHGTRNVARAAAEAGAQRLLHVSSVAVYGYDLAGDIYESRPHTPSKWDFYMQTKSMGEQALWRDTAATQLPTVSIRPAFVYGPGSALWSKRWYDICVRFGAVLVNGGTGSAHPIYIDDLVDLMITAAVHPNAPGQVFHAAPDPAPTWAEFLGCYAAMAGKPTPLAIPLPPDTMLKPFGMAAGLAARLVGMPYDLFGAATYMTRRFTYRMTRAAEVLGWQPRVSLAEGMGHTELWLKQGTTRSSHAALA